MQRFLIFLCVLPHLVSFGFYGYNSRMFRHTSSFQMLDKGPSNRKKTSPSRTGGSPLSKPNGYRQAKPSISANNNELGREALKNPPSKEKTGNNHQIVERILPLSGRKPLSEYSLGQKCKGQVISIVKHGYFIDVGSTRDGLLHVSDVSKDYFVGNDLSKFKPGEVIDVWVKFVDPTKSKIGLQLFPLSTSQTLPTKSSPSGITTPTKKSILFFPSETAVNGTVTKVSEYGVYVDIGAPVVAFLPKRKMKMTKKQFKFKAWEIHPLHSQVNGFVHEVDREKNRICMTTYAPEDWDEKMPSKDFVVSDGMSEDDEELGGSSRADISNTRALEKTLALTLDEYEDEEGEEYAEELSVAEINALTGGRPRAQLLIDETNDGKNLESISIGNDNKEDEITRKGVEMTTGLSDLEGEEITTEELFEELGEGRPYLTIGDIKRWPYLKDFLDSGDIDVPTLKALVSEAGTQGKLNVDQLDDFLDLLVETLGLVDIDEAGEIFDLDEGYEQGGEVEDDGDEEIDTNFISSSDTTSVTDDSDDQFLILDNIEVSNFKSDEISPGVEIVDQVEDGHFPESLSFASGHFSDEIIHESKGFGKPRLSLEDHFIQKSSTNDLFQHVFNGVAGNKGYITIEDVLKWDFAAALIAQKGIDENGVRTIYSDCCKRKDGKCDRKTFEKIVDKLSEIDVTSSLNSISNSTHSAEVLLPPGTAVLKSTRESAVDKPIMPDLVDFEAAELTTEKFLDLDEINEDEYDEMTPEEAFEELSAGKSYVKFEALFQWELVAELVEDGVIDRARLQELFLEAGAKKGKLSFDGFNEFVDLLMPYADDDSEEDFEELPDDLQPYDENDEDDIDEDVIGEHDDNIDERETLDVTMTDDVSSARTESSSDEDSEEEESSSLIVESEGLPNADDIQYSRMLMATATTSDIDGEPVRVLSPEEVEAMDDDTILKNVFNGLAGNKGHVSIKDLLNWDFVVDLMVEDILDEESLGALMTECGSGKKGLSLEAFDKLVDALVDKYGNFVEEDNDEDDADSDDGTNSAVDPEVLLMDETEGEDVAGDTEPTDSDHEETWNIDINESFDNISQGKGYVTMLEVMNWEFVRNLLADEYIEEWELYEIITEAEIADPDRMKIEDFEKFVTYLADRFTDDDQDGYEGETDEDQFSDDDDVYEQDTKQLAEDLKRMIDWEEEQKKNKGGST